VKKRNLSLTGLIIVLAMMVSLLAACGGNNNSKASSGGSSEPSAATGDKKLTFGYIAYNMKDSWNAYSAEAFEYAGKEKGVNTIVLDSENNLEKSVSLMQDLINKKVDGISVFPISPEQAATLSKMANDASIPITFENLKPADNAGDYISVIAAEYDLIGEEGFNFIAKTWPGAKVLFVAGAKGGGVYEKYQEGIDRAMKTIGDKVTIVDTVHGDWETEKAMNVTQSFIQSGKEFDVVFANNELMGKGVMNALKEAGLDKKVKVVSTGGGPDGLKMIEDGEITATMSAPVSLQGLITFRNLYQHANGKTPEKFTPLPIIPVTKETLAEAVSWKVDEKAVKYIGGLD
jgi:ribose transport system substrate-binding protein